MFERSELHFLGWGSEKNKIYNLGVDLADGESKTKKGEFMEEKIRLQKYLASMGIASRRKCEEYINQGKVKINGETVTELGIKVDPNKVKIEFNGKEIKNKNI